MPIPKSATPRILRAAKAINGGYELLELLRSPKCRKLLKSAVPLNKPSVGAIADLLLDAQEHGALTVDLKAMPVRQFIGMVVKAVMAEEGYEVAETGVRLPEKSLFTVGAVYRPKEEMETSEPDIIERFVSVLDQGELERLIRTAKSALTAK